MWGRVVEVMLGGWLAMSPFVFHHAPDARALWTTDVLAATAIVTLALLSFQRHLRRAHLGQLLVAAWLVVVGWLGAPAPAAQNHLVVGLLLAMLAIVPSHASRPSPSWEARWSRRTPAPVRDEPTEEEPPTRRAPPLEPPSRFPEGH
ncbi:MAG: SPW repeat protein, partial [Myxococcota bacterium]